MPRAGSTSAVSSASTAASGDQQKNSNKNILDRLAKQLEVANADFLDAAGKVTKWIGDERAFYKDAQPDVCSILLVHPE
jgi:hypothetical protein